MLGPRWRFFMHYSTMPLAACVQSQPARRGLSRNHYTSFTSCMQRHRLSLSTSLKVDVGGGCLKGSRITKSRLFAHQPVSLT